MEHVLVLGASGTVGTEVTATLGHAAVQAIPHQACDIVDRLAVRALLGEHRPRIVVNCAAFTNVDGCDEDPERAYAVNAIGAENVALAAAELGATLVHYSTDYVFDGSAGRAYDEFDSPNPLAHYGRSKLAGDRLVAAVGGRYLILRIGHVYGDAGRNFGSTLWRRLSAGEAISADGARVVAPTWAHDVAEQTKMLLEADCPSGLYHATSLGSCTWFEFACAMKDLGRHTAAIEPINATGRSPRPACSPLVSRLLPLRGLLRMPTWRDGLEQYVRTRQKEPS